jgi:D-threonate/D-erythronate kinase
MIAVLADDLTGAAEVAGVAFAHGLRASVMTALEPLPDRDVVVIDTDTRSRPAADAAAIVRRAAVYVGNARPDWIYKKTDSLLRGPVAAEIEALLAAMDMSRCLLVPANPSRGRVVRDAELWVGERRVHETDFARDPEHPRLVSGVRDLLHASSDRIEVPDVARETDLRRLVEQAARPRADVLWAGAVDFFQALLAHHVPARAATTEESAVRARCVVLISGSRQAWGAAHVAMVSTPDLAVRVMPERLTQRDASDADREAWTRQLAEAIAETPRVLIAVGRGTTADARPAALAARLAGAAVEAIQRAGVVERVLAEGGATAAAVARAFGWTRFDVAAQPAAGAVALRPPAGDAPEFVIKVGSYGWPAALWGGPLSALE